jgi:hypothetical protein
MAVVSMMRFAGDADDLARRMKDVAEVIRPLAERHGALAHILARTNDGLLVVNLWETEEGRHTMAAEPEVRAALERGGFPEPAFEGFEVIELFTTDRLAAHVATPA